MPVQYLLLIGIIWEIAGIWNGDWVKAKLIPIQVEKLLPILHHRTQESVLQQCAFLIQEPSPHFLTTSTQSIIEVQGTSEPAAWSIIPYIYMGRDHNITHRPQLHL
jgi:hypothetical protein